MACLRSEINAALLARKKSANVSSALSKIQLAELIKFASTYNITAPIIELAYRYVHNIINDPLCKTCQTRLELKTYETGFRQYCSKRCMNDINAERRTKAKATLTEKYGVSSPFESQVIRNRAKQTALIRYGVANAGGTKAAREQAKQTFLAKSGYDHPMRSPEHKGKFIASYQAFLANDEALESRSMQAWETRLANWLPKRLALIEAAGFKPLFASHEYLGHAVEHKWLHVCCGTEVNDNIINGSNPRCHVCEPKFRSRIEHEVALFIESLGVSIKRNDRTVLDGLELDIVVPSQKFAIELDGVYWHTELKGKDKHYHLKKTQLAAKAGYQLMHIFDDEWIDKNALVKSMITHKLNLATSIKIYARKCKVEAISKAEAAQFLIANHLQGSCVDAYRLGAYYNDQLIGVMTFGKARFEKLKRTELLRFAIKQGYHVPGLASKLLAVYRAEFNDDLIAYADLRHSTGGVYTKLGFRKISHSEPAYWYVAVGDKKRYHRSYFMKHKLADKLLMFDKTLSESENMKLNAYTRIYDCGALKLLLPKNAF
jgi:very-short-patch-repair endonuclease